MAFQDAAAAAEVALRIHSGVDAAAAADAAAAEEEIQPGSLSAATLEARRFGRDSGFSDWRASRSTAWKRC